MKKRFSLLTALVVMAGTIVGVGSAAASVPPSEWVIGPRGRAVFLVFEGQPRGKHLDSILSTLKKKNVRASFFISGAWIDHHESRARKILRQGHRLGNRGYGSGDVFTTMDDASIRSSISRGAQAIKRVGGAAGTYLRAPKGRRDLRVLQIAGSMNYRSVGWTYHPGGQRVKAVRRDVLNRARAGAILSFDSWRASHRNSLSRIIGVLRDREFRFNTLGKLRDAAPIRWDVTLRSGSNGSEVKTLQKRLSAISYPAGNADGNFGYATLQAVYAFEKVHRLARDGVVTPAQMTEIAKSRRPPIPRGAPRNYVDVDISRQVLFEVKKKRVVHTLPISSGNEEYYESEGQTYKAHTPRGSFKIERKIPGWRTSHLGRLWYPSYFIGGFAFHGSDSVPTYPASHGCIRLPMYVAKKFYYRNPIGTYVFVHD
jgi:peptidoglycan/xylan/chitin deacetylase (PgdA/CDA1 family)